MEATEPTLAAEVHLKESSSSSDDPGINPEITTVERSLHEQADLILEQIRNDEKNHNAHLYYGSGSSGGKSVAMDYSGHSATCTASEDEFGGMDILRQTLSNISSMDVEEEEEDANEEEDRVTDEAADQLSDIPARQVSGNPYILRGAAARNFISRGTSHSLPSTMVQQLRYPGEEDDFDEDSSSSSTMQDNYANRLLVLETKFAQLQSCGTTSYYSSTSEDDHRQQASRKYHHRSSRGHRAYGRRSSTGSSGGAGRKTTRVVRVTIKNKQQYLEEQQQAKQQQEKVKQQQESSVSPRRRGSHTSSSSSSVQLSTPEDEQEVRKPAAPRAQPSAAYVRRGSHTSASSSSVQLSTPDDSLLAKQAISAAYKSRKTSTKPCGFSVLKAFLLLAAFSALGLGAIFASFLKYRSDNGTVERPEAASGSSHVVEPPLVLPTESNERPNAPARSHAVEPAPVSETARTPTVSSYKDSRTYQEGVAEPELTIFCNASSRDCKEAYNYGQQAFERRDDDMAAHPLDTTSDGQVSVGAHLRQRLTTNKYLLHGELLHPQHLRAERGDSRDIDRSTTARLAHLHRLLHGGDQSLGRVARYWQYSYQGVWADQEEQEQEGSDLLFAAALSNSRRSFLGKDWETLARESALYERLTGGTAGPGNQLA